MADITTYGIQGLIVTPTSQEYNGAIARHSATSVLRPAYVVYPTSTGDISLAIKFALDQSPPLQIAIKSGGCHSSTNSSTEGGVVIDLSHYKALKVSGDKQTVTVQGGAIWGDVYTELEKHNLVVVGGNVWFVGVGGFITGGGHSHLSGALGLAVDNLVGATVVLADGRVVQCSDAEEADLFWAIRGGGGQFGVVAEFVLKAHPARASTLVGALAYPAEELPKILELLKEHIKTQSTGSKLVLCFARSPVNFQPSILLLPYVEGTPKDSETSIDKFRTEVQPVFEQLDHVPSFTAVSHASDSFLANSPPRSIFGGVAFGELWDDIITRVYGEWVEFTENEDRKEAMVMWEFGVRDKISEIPSTQTAYALRDPHYYAVFSGRHTQADSDLPTREWIKKMITYVSAENTKRTGKVFRTQMNFAMGPEYTSVEDIFGDNLERLRKVKAKYDPTKVWNKGWVIEPEASG
ncbi:hypothetical protein NLI96_g6192 [Meripilus lineatus]|uniref:FAD-binding PCMH-type domain-containing protein n=1 Tax=Meripilus lineatus TaxID=2056292 RepID=A0AAD5V1C3_9APHY|nr:hypothetical protein NLI96_g6192 [Physisporinus lineatus]